MAAEAHAVALQHGLDHLGRHVGGEGPARRRVQQRHDGAGLQVDVERDARFLEMHDGRAEIAPDRQGDGVGRHRRQRLDLLDADAHRIEPPHAGEPDLQRRRPEIVAAGLVLLGDEVVLGEADEIGIGLGRRDADRAREIGQRHGRRALAQREEQPASRLDRLDAATLALPRSPAARRRPRRPGRSGRSFNTSPRGARARGPLVPRLAPPHQCTAAYMIFSSVASWGMNSSTTRPRRDTRMRSERFITSGR